MEARLATKTVKNPMTMEELVEEQGDNVVPYHVGGTCEVTVLDVKPRKVVADVAGLAIGIIPEREFSFDTIELKSGDKVNAYVLSMENEEGYVVLSLKRADRETLWQVLQGKQESGEMMSVKVVGANRGGLLVESGGLDGFIPVSQLSPEHYPRVEGGSGMEIARRLQELIGQTLKVKVLNVDKQASKLIFSEKMAQGLLQDTAVDTVKLGDVLEGTVTGIVPFGIFVNAGGVEGLVHISEISWDRVTNVNTMFEVSQKVKIKVIQIDGNRVSFSLKRLETDPWIEAYKTLKPGTEIEGEVTRVTDFGAFVKISDRIAGLCHVSQMGENIEDPSKVLQVSQKYNFKIISIEPSNHRCSLQLVPELGVAQAKRKTKSKGKDVVASRMDKVEKVPAADREKELKNKSVK
jgi:small subunit ribosomal protein S1